MVAGPSASRRAAAAVAAAGVQAMLLYALLFGLAATLPARIADNLQLIELIPEPPPPPPPPVKERVRDRRDEGEGSPPNLRSEATQVMAPKPVIPLPVPPPVVAAPLPARGNARSQGAAEVPGPGIGRAGEGDGPGRGRRGPGEGADGVFTPPRLIRGGLSDADYPAAIGEAGGGGTVSVRFSVETDGRVGRCLIDRSSGNPELDAVTCRLIRQRYRFRPSLDPEGRPVRSQMIEDHSWVTLDDPEPPREQRRRRRLF